MDQLDGRAAYKDRNPMMADTIEALVAASVSAHLKYRVARAVAIKAETDAEMAKDLSRRAHEALDTFVKELTNAEFLRASGGLAV